MLKKYFLIIISIAMLSVGLTSCEWKQIEPIDVLPENVSFSNDVIPIFTQSCNSVGCHNSGGISPDLSEENAFNVLTTGNMLNIDNPANYPTPNNVARRVTYLLPNFAESTHPQTKNNT